MRAFGAIGGNGRFAGIGAGTRANTVRVFKPHVCEIRQVRPGLANVWLAAMKKAG
jgi:hypothetical protein